MSCEDQMLMIKSEKPNVVGNIPQWVQIEHANNIHTVKAKGSQ